MNPKIGKAFGLGLISLGSVWAAMLLYQMHQDGLFFWQSTQSQVKPK